MLKGSKRRSYFREYDSMSPRKASKGGSFRKRAENLLSKHPEDISQLPADDVKKLIHELQVHQIDINPSLPILTIAPCYFPVTDLS